ncbi:MAG TPA: ABC transporter substrate-binding protein [Gemmatimonadaceae bacterium]|nr:ABC transporter substrate-binding protein [Gemmatimonadaceae bacterium]
MPSHGVPTLSGIVVSASIAVFACSGDRRAGGTAGETQKDALVIGVAGDEYGLQLNRSRVGMYPLNASICEAPFRLSQALATEPSLGAKAEHRGGNTLRVTLRGDVTFHDGTPLTAIAVKETMDRSVRLRTQYSFLSDSSVRIVDDTTIDITPSVLNLRLAEQLAHPTYGVTATGTDPTIRPICTGPFQFVEYVPKSHITVERYDGYWGQKARIKRLTFRFYPDDNTRALALRAGEVDGIYDVNRGMVRSLQKLPGIRVVTSPPGAVMLMHVATRGAAPYDLMSEPALRRAVALGIDRRLLVDRVLGGYASVVSTVNPPVVLGRHAPLVNGIAYDADAARRTLDSAGWKAAADGSRSRRGRRLELSLISQTGVVDRAVLEFVQAQLAQVGIRVRVEQLEAGAFESRLNSGRFDIDIEVPNQNDANPAFLLALRWYTKSNVRSAPFMLAGPRFDSLVAASLAAPERDAAQRFAALAMHELVDRQAAAIPLAGIFRIHALSTRIRGFEPHPARVSQSWSEAWVAK